MLAGCSSILRLRKQRVLLRDFVRPSARPSVRLLLVDEKYYLLSALL